MHAGKIHLETVLIFTIAVVVAATIAITVGTFIKDNLTKASAALTIGGPRR